MCLFIDTHLNDIIIILYHNDEIVRKKIISNEKENSRLIMPTLEEVVGNEQLDSIIVVNGPGSFTGVRLGVTVAKTLAYTLNIPIRTITSLECIAISTNNMDKIVAFCDKNGYYVGIFDNNINLIGNYEYLNKQGFAEFNEKYNVIMDIDINYLDVIKFALKRPQLNPHTVNPIYIKKIDVEK